MYCIILWAIQFEILRGGGVMEKNVGGVREKKYEGGGGGREKIKICGPKIKYVW